MFYICENCSIYSENVLCIWNFVLYLRKYSHIFITNLYIFEQLYYIRCCSYIYLTNVILSGSVRHISETRSRNLVENKIVEAGEPVSMIVDTGATKSIINEATYLRLSKTSTPLQSTSAMLSTYTGEKIPVLGELMAPVQYDNQKRFYQYWWFKAKAPICLATTGSQNKLVFNICGKGWKHQ